jgi:digeranylgeranylglycerophospholipid reductase
MVADNLLVAGDAAHHVNPAHGGGIGIAMEAGRMAAQRAAEALKAHDYSAKFLDEYTKKWYETRGNDLKKVLKARNMLEVLNDSDFEVLVDSITADDVMKIAKGDISKERLALGVIVKNPKAAAVFMKYLAAKKD